jgi:hypothetical protein
MVTHTLLGLPRTSLLGLLALGLSLGSSPRALPTAAGDRDLRDLLPTAKVSLTKAVAASLEAQPGQVVEAALEREESLVWEVKVVGMDGHQHELTWAAMDGRLIEDEVDDDELTRFRELLRHSELTLVGLVDAAGGLVQGQPAAALMGFDDGGPLCEVLIVKDRYLVDVDVEARAGHIVDIELVGFVGDDDDEDGDRARGGEDEACCDGDDEGLGDDSDDGDDEADEEDDDQ